jgi:hypothetical protein
MRMQAGKQGDISHRALVVHRYLFRIPYTSLYGGRNRTASEADIVTESMWSRAYTCSRTRNRSCATR